MRRLTFTNSRGESIEFFNSPYSIDRIDGLSVPPVLLQEQKAPYQHGTTYIDSIFDKRQIIIEGSLSLAKRDLAEIATARAAMQHILNPLLGVGSITFQNDSFTRYASASIDAFTLPNKDARDGFQRFQLTLNCHDPFLYGPELTVTSPGAEWAARTLPASEKWIDAAYGAGLYVAIAQGTDAYATSTDGETWTARTLPLLKDYTAIAFGNDHFVILARDIALISDDGITWTDAGDLTIATFYDGHAAEWEYLTFGNLGFCAVTRNNTFVAMSPTGETWTITNLQTIDTFSSVCHGDGKYIITCYGSAHYYISANGTTWEYRALPFSANWIGCGWKNGRYILAASESSAYLYSSDGLTWTEGAFPYSINITRVIVTERMFVVSGETGSSFISTDGISWNSRTNVSAAAWISGASGAGDKITMISNGDVTDSVANVSGQRVYGQGLYFYNQYMSIDCGVVFSFGKFWVLIKDTMASTYSIQSSVNGKEWAIVSGTPAFSTAKSMRVLNGAIYIAIMDGIIRTTDGVTWTKITVSAGVQYTDIAYGNSIYVLITKNSAAFATSTNGTSWTGRTWTALSREKITYGAGLFVISLSGTATVSTSADGLTWNVTGSGLSSLLWNEIIFGNGIFLMVNTTANTTTYATSSDGVTWIIRTFATSSEYTTRVYFIDIPTVGRTDYFVWAAKGKLYYSENGITWTLNHAFTNTRVPATLYFAIDTTNEIALILYDFGITFINNLFPIGQWVGASMSYISLNTDVTFKIGSKNDNSFSGFIAARIESFVFKSEYSIDGINWIENSDISVPDCWFINKLQLSANGSTVYCLVSGSPPARLFRTTDGINWTNNLISSTIAIISVTEGAGLYVAHYSGTTYLTSPDGVTWTSRTSGANWGASSFCLFANGMFIVVTPSSATYYTSTNGTAWTSRTLPSASNWRDIAFGAGLFVLVAIGGTGYATSPDGIAWTARALPVTTAALPIAVKYLNGVFIVTSDTIHAISADGIAWTNYPSAMKVLRTWAGIAYHDGAIVFLDQWGGIYRSFTREYTRVIDTAGDDAQTLDSVSVTVAGDYSTPMEITINGPDSAAIVALGDKQLQLNTTIDTGESIIINTAFGARSIVIRDAVGIETNGMRNLVLGSEFFDLELGENQLLVLGNDVEIKYRERFIGV